MKELAEVAGGEEDCKLERALAARPNLAGQYLPSRSAHVNSGRARPEFTCNWKILYQFHLSQLGLSRLA